jgi:hypothetical protein
MDINYKKYLKYKLKYLELKKQSGGGGTGKQEQEQGEINGYVINKYSYFYNLYRANCFTDPSKNRRKDLNGRMEYLVKCDLHDNNTEFDVWLKTSFINDIKADINIDLEKINNIIITAKSLNAHEVSEIDKKLKLHFQNITNLGKNIITNKGLSLLDELQTKLQSIVDETSKLYHSEYKKSDPRQNGPIINKHKQSIDTDMKVLKIDIHKVYFEMIEKIFNLYFSRAKNMYYNVSTFIPFGDRK